MTINVQCGDTYLIDYPGHPKEHLFVVVTNIEPKTGQFIIVSLESADNPRAENLVILSPGDHPFIKHRTSVVYRMASIFSLDSLNQLIVDGNAIQKEPMRLEILDIIKKGLQKSKHTPDYVKDFFREVTWPL